MSRRNRNGKQNLVKPLEIWILGVRLVSHPRLMDHLQPQSQHRL